MRSLIYLLVGIAILAGAAFGVRHYEIDLAALTGFGSTKTVAAGGEAPQRQGGGRANRGPAAVETARAATSRLSDDVSALGTLLSDESVEIAPETSGRVSRVLFADGAKVEKGTPLFQFDSDLAKSDLAEAEARLKLAEASFARNQKLRQSGNVAQSAYDEALSGRDVARAAVEAARVRLDKLTIAAPFSGTLGFRNVSEGAYVTAGTALVKLDKTDRLQVSFAVPELQQQAVMDAATVTFTADAVPGETFTATIDALNPVIDVNGRALQVRADADNAAGRLRPGLLVRVAVKGPEREAVMVPESAVVQRAKGAMVYTLSGDKVTEVKVRLGKRVEGKVEVLDGIAAGDTVVTAGNAQLSNGAKVEVVSTAAAAE
ncbi:efflux transporter periplasmic adaptor subunit [Aestuariivirga litoralis]|uniref:Efflux transporter periplasmic adaptor subunit n=1 Tax=Aestuariivirga litoralis TaxID=2650924 RepID=A0A2W2AP99_9HYPH|nr:efflux RND transporter periplasmic adaptor subunit [Aestuariivirga litoralis]PZF77221.1 efflux transporter periplasmic adaptor subunit [Aestuariivirga litoralis]